MERRVHGCDRFEMQWSIRRSRGFTLTELMVVVAMVGILAVVGISLFRKWIFHTRSVEAVGMVQSIRVAQESWRAQTGSYMNVSTSNTSWYPTSSPGRKLYAWWQPTGPDYGKWRLLNPTVSGSVQFGYMTNAGPPFTQVLAPECTSKPVWPAANQMFEPWYLIQSMGDTDENGVKSYYVASSVNGELYRENEGE